MRCQPVLPVDPQMVDETGYPWALLSEAADPAAITPDAVVVVGTADDPLLARVLDVAVDGEESIVHLDVFGPVAAVERAIHAA